MRTLFVISMLCFSALLLAVLALVRKVYQAQYLLRQRDRNRDARLRTSQGPEIFGRRSYDEEEVEHTIAGRVAFAGPTLRPAPQQSVGDLAPAKSPDWRFMVHADGANHHEGASSFNPERPKPPQPTHFGGRERLDWAYFNKDLGDLSDPYEPPRFTGTANARPATNKPPL